MSLYGLEALLRLRERQEAQGDSDRTPHSVFEEVPLNAVEDDAALTVWNGERFVAWEKWWAAAPIESGDPEQLQPVVPVDADCISADCGDTRIWLKRDGERWLMFAGGRRARNRLKDFASPYVEHAIRTAETWFGAPAGGWRSEEKRDGLQRTDKGNK